MYIYIREGGKKPEEVFSLLVSASIPKSARARAMQGDAGSQASILSPHMDDRILTT